MFPENLLKRAYRLKDGEIIPHFLDAGDHPWLRVLMEEFLRFTGKPRRELDRRMRGPLPCACPPGKKALAAHVLCRLCRDRQHAAVSPRDARAALFNAGATYPGRPGLACDMAAEKLGVSREQLLESLFADLPAERRLSPPPKDLSPADLALRTNQALARALLFRAVSVRIEILGNARAVVRHAKLRGLICTVRRKPRARAAVLEISGPFSLFRKTLVYGRALGELVPMLAWCSRFQLHAECMIRDQSAALRLSPADPIFPGPEPKRFDSRLEERFARDFGRLAPDWELVREPEPVEACGTLIFPDFALWPREKPKSRWLLEIVGYWTPDYLARKLARLRAARLSNLILCIDEERNCTGDDLPPQARVVRFRRKVDARDVLRIIEEEAAASSIGKPSPFPPGAAS